MFNYVFIHTTTFQLSTQLPPARRTSLHIKKTHAPIACTQNVVQKLTKN